ncbi:MULTISPECIES: pantetheine-phosphate adenylyltransferase [Halobacteriovorax]|uniref:Phosphopantetheine adenylyltransferase n=1 Tax=Halobacteriovorax vibrionivorans TaxID=2152716 RepID=A0ABY0IHL2_9BACT|nr:MULTISPECIES: pantetheine-phosphate adenylyltransferase [Halobacteriovorax]AYF45354.1 pantetheine-phosphate adenylyltransferase [Halobacteriovorax sp. BALOs_7]RZF22438.1 pantetheine-phosphate adenylyltransferase [Halobacteriovorax vibrionivorans]
MKRAIYPGTFDPFTNGHKDILMRSLSVFDEVIILVAHNRNKKPFFTADERVAMLEETFKDEPRVKADKWEGLIVDYAKENEISSIIRGLRPTGDFEAEFQMASMNKRLYPEIETVFFITERDNYYVSSSLVKEIHKHGKLIKEFVPDTIFNWINKKGKV